MSNEMTGAELASTRQLLGLSAQQLAEILKVNPRTIRGWESSKYNASSGFVRDIQALVNEHTDTVDRLCEAAADGTPIALPYTGTETRPRSWWLAIGARLIDRHPDAMLGWK